jgi:hypothetical protein
MVTMTSSYKSCGRSSVVIHVDLSWGKSNDLRAPGLRASGCICLLFPRVRGIYVSSALPLKFELFPFIYMYSNKRLL